MERLVKVILNKQKLYIFNKNTLTLSLKYLRLKWKINNISRAFFEQLQLQRF